MKEQTKTPVVQMKMVLNGKETKEKFELDYFNTNIEKAQSDFWAFEEEVRYRMLEWMLDKVEQKTEIIGENEEAVYFFLKLGEDEIEETLTMKDISVNPNAIFKYIGEFEGQIADAYLEWLLEKVNCEYELIDFE